MLDDVNAVKHCAVRRKLTERTQTAHSKATFATRFTAQISVHHCNLCFFLFTKPFFLFTKPAFQQQTLLAHVMLGEVCENTHPRWFFQF